MLLKGTHTVLNCGKKTSGMDCWYEQILQSVCTHSEPVILQSAGVRSLTCPADSRPVVEWELEEGVHKAAADTRTPPPTQTGTTHWQKTIKHHQTQFKEILKNISTYSMSITDSKQKCLDWFNLSIFTLLFYTHLPVLFPTTSGENVAL